MKELLADTETPVSLFLALHKGERCAVLYESVEGRERWARRSLIAIGARDVVTAHKPDDVRSLFDSLRLEETARSPLDFAFGYFAYEAAKAFVPLPHTPAARGPVAEFFRPEAVFLYDHREHLLEGHFATPEIETRLMAKLGPREAMRRAAPPQTRAVRRQHQDYQAAVRKAKEYIAAGDAFQIVGSQRFVVEAAGIDLFDAYRHLRQKNPSPYLFYFRSPSMEAAGASPETLVRVEDDTVRVRPIAGTRKRGANDEEDRALETELLADPKERAEHLMLVDLGRNDVGRVSEPASVRVEPMMTVERYSHVMHIVSEVQGTLRKDCTALDALASAFPAGTLSGAPKKRAMEIIGELEGEPRGLYGGAVGYFASRRACDFAIAIRTLFREGDAVIVQAGAGLVFDSDPAAEDEECVNKAASPLASVGATP